MNDGQQVEFEHDEVGSQRCQWTKRNKTSRDYAEGCETDACRTHVGRMVKLCRMGKQYAPRRVRA